MNSFSEITQTSEEIIEAINTCDPEQEDLLRKSIELWHDKGYFDSLSSKELTNFIFTELISDKSQDNPFLDIYFDFYMRCINLTSNRKCPVPVPVIDIETQSLVTKIRLDPITIDDFKYCIQKIYPNKKMNSLDENTKKLIVYLAFILSSIAVGILAKNAIDDSKKKQASKLPASRNVLVLVVSHQEFESCFYIKGNTLDTLSENDCKNLYGMTKYLWLGSENQFFNIGFSKWFSTNNISETQESSDYDVRLIKIVLQEYSADFKKGVFEKGVTNRLPEFKKLSENIIEGIVSDRLPPKAYNYPQFYR